MNIVKAINFVIESKIEHIPLLSKAIKSVCSFLVEDEVELYKIELCIFEAVTNIVKHTYQNNPENFVDVRLELSDEFISFFLTDTGSPIELKRPELNFDPKDTTNLPTSHMGLYLIYEIMDEVTSKYVNNKNILAMKYIKKVKK